MKEIDNFLQKESAKLFQLLKNVQENRKVQDKVWDDFCRKTNEEAKKRKCYFKKHPKHISSSSSDILTPKGLNISERKKSKSLKVLHPWKSEASSDGNQKSQSSLDVVTVREEISIVRNGYLKKVYGKPSWDGGERKEVNATGASSKSNNDAPKQTVQRKMVMKKPAMKKQIMEKTEKPPRDVITEVNIEAKLNHVLDKTLRCMEDIRMQIDAGIMSPDGDDDLDRRKKRSVEFASRFSRNYLYQLNRQINDILQITSQLKGNITNRTACSIRQKLAASYQTLLQGLQAYYNHLPVSTTNAVPDKVRELLKLTSSLCDIHRSCANRDLNSNLEKEKIIDVFEVRSRCLLEKINEKYFCPSSTNLTQNNNTVDGYQSKVDNRRNPHKKKSNVQKNRYAMYNVTPMRNDDAWKKACAILAKKKFNVSSRYKTANFKHRPPVDKQTPIPKQILKVNKVVERKSSGRIKPKSLLNDDNIQTVVQWHTDKESDNLNSDSKNANSINNLIGQVVNTIREENKEVSQHQVRNILQGFLEYVGGSQEIGRDQQVEKKASEEEAKDQRDQSERRDEKWSNVENFDVTILEKVVEVLRRNQESIKRAKEVCEQNTKEETQEKKHERKKTITVTGAKNAKLICIKDEDTPRESPLEDACQPNVEVKKKLSKHSTKSKDRADNLETKSLGSDVQRNCSERISKIKISRLPRGPLRQLKMLPKKLALDILEYKINYMKSRKGNHMYKKSATKQPWVLMGEIADKILDELIEGVGSEIQVNGVIDSIYASEFTQ